MASRGGMVALLLAVPILIAAAIGFSAGGGLPFGISSFASGPGTTSSSDSSGADHGPNSISRLVGSASTAAVTPIASTGAGNGSGGGSGARGDSGGNGGGSGGGGGHHTATSGGSTGGGSSSSPPSSGNGNSITIPNPTNPNNPGPTIQIPSLPVSPPSVPNPGGGGNTNPLGGVTGALPGGSGTGTGAQNSNGGPLGGIVNIP